jgi:hypothetical protein
MSGVRRRDILGMVGSAAGLSLLDGIIPARAVAAPAISARLVAIGIPGASAIAEVGTFLNDPAACSRPIPTLFPSYIQPGAVLDPKRILVGSSSNFGALLTIGVGRKGAYLSIDPSGTSILRIPSKFASSGDQASTLGGFVQMFSANSPFWLNSANNPGAVTAQYPGVSNPLGLSNSNAFGRVWPANSPFGETGVGTSSILDPTGQPLNGPPNPQIGGVYVGTLTDRDQVSVPPQIIKGALRAGAVGTALLGPSPDGSCKAVFCVVTADGAILQEHTLKGLDGLAPPGTVRPLIGRWWDRPHQHTEPRLGVIMNPYTQAPVVRQLFVSEPFYNTIAVIDLVVFGTAPDQVFAHPHGHIKRISSLALNLPVDLAPVDIDTDNINWASNTALDEGSDFYVANRGNNTILRMRQDGTVVAVRRVDLNGDILDDARLNGIATARDGSKIYLTFTGPDEEQGGVLEVPAFS